MSRIDKESVFKISMFSSKYIFYQARLSKTLIWPFKIWKRWRDKAIPTIYRSHCICWNILVSAISEMDDGRWKSVAHLRRVTFTALVMDESYFFVSSNPPLLSCKSCSGHQPYFFFQFTQVKWYIHSTWNRLLQELLYISKNRILLCAL